MNWLFLKKTCAIGVIALIASGCSSSRVVRESRYGIATYSMRDSVSSSVVDAVHDTIREVTTVMIQLGAEGDTTFQSVVTDRERFRDRSRQDVATHRSEVRVDTVYVERRDSVLVKNSNRARASPLLKNLKWILWIIIALIGVIIILKIRRF